MLEELCGFELDSICSSGTKGGPLPVLCSHKICWVFFYPHNIGVEWGGVSEWLCEWLDVGQDPPTTWNNEHRESSCEIQQSNI